MSTSNYDLKITMTDYCLMVEIKCSVKLPPTIASWLKSTYLYIDIYPIYFNVYQLYTRTSRQTKNKQKNPQKQETQQSDTNMIKHDRKGLDKLIAAKQTFYQ